MSRQFPTLGLVLTWALVVTAGCQPQQPFYFHERGNLEHYRGVATEIDVPDDRTPSLADVTSASAPLSISNPDPKEVWDLTLEEAMKHSMTNAKVMKQLGAAVLAQAGSNGPSNPDYLLRNPNAAPTMYDPALAETDPRSGVEAALSAFDAQFSSSLSWGKTDEAVNVSQPNTATIAPVNIADNATFQARLQQTNATGGTVALTHNVVYLNSNSLTQQYPSDYNANIEAEIRQPLLRGSGVEFNRIAGPGATEGVNNGVVIARINTDIALAGFEAGVRNHVVDVENAYWELYFTYRSLDAVIAGRDSALATWRKTYALYLLGAKGGEADREAQAREQYFLFRSSVERALSSLYKAEGNLRYMMGIASTDGRLIRPVDEPTTAKVDFDWCAILNESLVRSVELRQQRWLIKRRELELIASKNYLLPRLDAVARYRWLGVGQQLASSNPNDGAITPGNSIAPFAYNNLLDGQFQEWTAGFEFSMPLGFRRELSGVRNAEEHLARERVVLQEQELELSHQLAYAVRDLDTNLALSKTNFNRRIAAKKEVDAVQAAYETGTVAIDVLLNAQRILAQAESDYYRSVVDYNKAIAQVHYRKGSLLEYNGVFLAEGPWPAKAYFDACKLARARDAGKYIDYGVTRPHTISRGEYQQQMNGTGGAMINPADGQQVAGELTPVPDPRPMQPTPAPQLQPGPAPEPVQQKPAGSQATAPQLLRRASTAQPAAGVSAAPAPQWSGVKQTGYEWTAAKKVSANPSRGSWTSSEPSATANVNTSYDAGTDSTSAAADRSAAGWTRAQR